MQSLEIGDLPQKNKISITLKDGLTRYQRKIKSNEEFLRLIKRNTMSDAVIREVKQRQILVNNKWVTDFASCNYLGFDVHPEIMASATDHIQKLSTYPGQSRLLGSPYLYEKIEQEVIELAGLPDCILMPSITLTHLYAMPILAEEGDLFLDKRAHKTIYDGCMRATQFGANIVSFLHNDCQDLEQKLKQSTASKKIICVDGVYSMHGYTAPISEMLRLCEKYDAYLLVDDAHGFGVLGERAADETCPFGKKGNGVVKHYGETYDRVIYVGGLSKSYSSLLGFISCKPEEKDFLKVSLDPYLYSGPAPIPALSFLLKSFEVNRREGDDIRAHLYKISKNFEKGVEEMGWRNENRTGFPVYRLTLENPDDVHFAGEFLYEHGIYVTLAPYPLVPKHEVGFRVQLTAANTQAEVDHLLETIATLEKQVPIQKEDAGNLKVEIKSLEAKKNTHEGELI